MLPAARRTRGFASDSSSSVESIDENPQLARVGRSSSFRRSPTTRSSNVSLPRQESQRSMLFYVDEMKSRSGDLKSSRGRSSSKSRSLRTDSLGSLQSPNGTSESNPFSPPSEIEINSSRVERRLMRENSQRLFDSRELVISFDSKPLMFPRDATKRRSEAATDLHLCGLAGTRSQL